MSDKITQFKRVNINLPESAYEDLRLLAASSGRSMTDIIRTGLSLASLASVESGKNNVLAIANLDGKILKELILPK